MVYVIALTSKLVFLLATFTPGPEIPLENEELPSCLTVFLRSPLSGSPVKHSNLSLAESPLAPGWVGGSLCLLCNFSLSTECCHSQVLPVLLELVNIRRWFNPRTFLLEKIFSHQMTYTLYTLVRVYNISEETYHYLMASQKCLKESWHNHISGAILKTFFQLTLNSFIQAKGRK